HLEEEGSQKKTSIIHQFSGDIKIENVSFGYGYQGINSPNIIDIKLHIKPRQVIGIVGHTGCGKSTLANLISGLFSPWTGNIY
ncbi:ATP-binding cassette domain-containing protein, partial [Staphylococcus aureus]